MYELKINFNSDLIINTFYESRVWTPDTPPKNWVGMGTLGKVTRRLVTYEVTDGQSEG